MWKLFEAENAPRKGVIAFITNRKYLTGWPYAGLRKMMRERFDRLEIIDLRGDVRAGVRGDVAKDEGVFSIMVGTAICIAVADGSKGERELADVRYRDAWEKGVFRKAAKLEWLESPSDSGQFDDYISVDRGSLNDLRPEPFASGNCVSLSEVFGFRSSGVETTRDHVAYGFNEADVRARIMDMQSLARPAAQERYSRSRKDGFAGAYAEKFEESHTRQASYRPLSRMTLYNSTNFVDWPRPKFQEVWGDENLSLWGLAYGTNLGPATWVHSLLPDRHAFSGRGGYAFPLYDRRKGADAHNLNPAALAALAEAYGETVSPEDLFDAILALLSATSYTLRFAEDLEDTFPHIPFPADPTLFKQAVAIGREIRALEGFQREPAPAFRPKDFCRLRSEATGPVGLSGGAATGEWLFCADGTGRFDGLPPRVWEFSVSGYRVLKRWVEARAGLDGPIYWPQFRDVAARIHELLHWFDRADLVLEAVLGDTLSRDELGLGGPQPEGRVEG